MWVVSSSSFQSQETLYYKQSISAALTIHTVNCMRSTWVFIVLALICKVIPKVDDNMALEEVLDKYDPSWKTRNKHPAAVVQCLIKNTVIA